MILPASDRAILEAAARAAAAEAAHAATDVESARRADNHASMAADEWAKRRGVTLEYERSGLRIAGDARPGAEALAAHERGAVDNWDLRQLLEVVSIRVETYRKRLEEETRALQTWRSEAERIAVHQQVLELLLGGKGMSYAAIAARFGKRSHAWTVGVMNEIKQYASGHVALRSLGECRRPGCTQPVVRETGERIPRQGRPRKYCSDACAKYVARANYDRRKGRAASFYR